MGFLRTVEGLVSGLRPWGTPERYRIACLYEDDPPRASQLWRHWPDLFPAFDPLIQALPEKCFLRSVQYDPVAAARDDRKGNVTRFRKLGWSEANNKRWVGDLAARADYQLSHTELWSPWVKDLEDRRGGPHLYLRIDAANENAMVAPEYDWQSLTLALRHDVLADTKAHAQAVLERAHGLMRAPKILVFDRTWAERGTYTGFVRVNGLEDSPPHTLERWCAAHAEAVRPRFDTP
jgi:hypothetical protein